MPAASNLQTTKPSSSSDSINMSIPEKELRRLCGRAIHQYQMIGDGDQILVGVSGGKDSLVLLKFLLDRRARTPIDYRVVAVHLDLGYEDPQNKVKLKKLFEEWEVEHHFEITDFAPVAHSDINYKRPCFFCSRLRRRRLFELAREFGCSKVALGHHRDDLNATLLMNIIYSGEISTMLPVQEFFGGLLTIIRPLCMVPEDKVRQVARRWKLPLLASGCPSDGQSRRTTVQRLIDDLHRTNDKVKGNIFRSLSNFRPDYLLPGNSHFPIIGNSRSESPSPAEREEAEVMDQEQRTRTRVYFQTKVHLQAGNRKLTDLSSKNLSLKGLYVETKEQFEIGTPVDISIELTGTTSLVSLKMKGNVARLDKLGMGIDFVEVDLDSFFHLRNIIKYNVDDSDNIDDEMTSKPAF